MENGAGNETRTRDLLDGNQMLYQLSYSRGFGRLSGFENVVKDFLLLHLRQSKWDGLYE